MRAEEPLAPVPVVMATFNGERWLPEQLNSFACQTRPPDDVLVFDDGSTDGTLDVLATFARGYAGRLHVTRRPQRLGAAASFSSAIEDAPDGVVVLSDQDDVWHDRRIDYALAALASADAVFANGELIDEGFHALGRTLWGSLGFTGRSRVAWDMDPLGILLAGNVVTGATLSFRRHSLAPFLPFGEARLARLCNRRPARRGWPMVADDRALVRYRVRGANAAGLPAAHVTGRRRSRVDHLASLTEVAGQLADLELSSTRPASPPLPPASPASAVTSSAGGTCPCDP